MGHERDPPGPGGPAYLASVGSRLSEEKKLSHEALFCWQISGDRLKPGGRLPAVFWICF